VTYSLLLETDETEREASPKGRVQPLPTPESSELPAASTGLGRNGYEGGFEITNSKYIASVGYQGVPGIGMAIILAVVMILMLIVYLVTSVCSAIACKFCNGAYKPRAFTKKDLFQNKMVIIAFVVVTAVGAFIIFAEAPNLVSGASDLTQAMADTISDLADDVTDINSAMTDASEDPMMSMITGISSTTSALDDGGGDGGRRHPEGAGRPRRVPHPRGYHHRRRRGRDVSASLSSSPPPPSSGTGAS
jgi:hypothetical protein